MTRTPGPDPLQHLGARERQIIDILFRLGYATATDVQEALDEPLSNSAVRGMLRLLVEKGLAGYVKDGPRYVYRPLLRAQEVRRSVLAHVVETFFKNSRSSAIAALLDMEHDALSDEEYERLAGLLKKARRSRGEK